MPLTTGGDAAARAVLSRRRVDGGGRGTEEGAMSRRLLQLRPRSALGDAVVNDESDADDDDEDAEGDARHRHGALPDRLSSLPCPSIPHIVITTTTNALSSHCVENSNRITLPIDKKIKPLNK